MGYYRPTYEDMQDANARAMPYKGGYAKKVYANYLIDVIRKESKTERVPLEMDMPSRSHEEACLLMATVDALPEPHRSVILAKAQFLDDKAAAEALGLSLCAYKTRLARARKYAREALSDDA